MERFVLQKAAPKSKSATEPKTAAVEDADGVLTRYGMEVAHQYALKWRTTQTRDVELERKHPALIGLFYDIRNDSELAAEHAIPFQKADTEDSSAFQKRYVIGVDPARPGSEQTVTALVKSDDPEHAKVLFVVPANRIPTVC